MKKLLSILTLFTVLIFGGTRAFADDASSALAQFNKYIAAANSYSPSVIQMYLPSAKITRQVVKPDGTTVNVHTDTATYIKQMKMSNVMAKAKGYTNSYSSASVVKASNGYKVSALRQPKGETYKLKMYQVWEKQADGNWKIAEEMMQTKEQIFLKYAK